ncbi:hypothetical protein SprV_0100514600 [Sparganum proliferum]
MQDARTARKAEEMQGYADRNQWKTLFAAIKTVYSPTAPLPSADGSILFTKKAQILQRWAEHFRSFLNHTSTISDAAIACLTRVETGVDLDLPPSLHETIKACSSSPAGKRCGVKEKSRRILRTPRSSISTRGKGGAKSDNRGLISLSNIAGKIFARILLNRLSSRLEEDSYRMANTAPAISVVQMTCLPPPSTGEVSGDMDRPLLYLRGFDESL